MGFYDAIGATYAATRIADPRIAAQIDAALGDAESVLNVGAGSGNYEPVNRAVIAVVPSRTMIDQRSTGAAPVVQAVAESLPFSDGHFDAAMGIFTIHHWTNPVRGLREVARVSHRQVYLTYEPETVTGLWILDYFPWVKDLPHERRALSAAQLSKLINVSDVQIVPIPKDCTDGFGGAFWARPERYLEPGVQEGMSMLAVLDPALRDAGTAQLRRDLESGEWTRRYGHLLTFGALDLG